MPGNRCTPEQICEMRERRIKTKSHYKMTCGCCGETIHRGDDITQVLGSAGQLRTRSLTCRYVGGVESSYDYSPTRNSWVHLHCRPSYWYTHGCSPMFCAGFTRYSDSIDQRRIGAAMDPDWGENYWEIPRPKWKFEKERIEKGVVTTFQRWRAMQPESETPHPAVQNALFHGMEVSVVFNKTKNSKGKFGRAGSLLCLCGTQTCPVGWSGHGYIPLVSCEIHRGW